MESARVQMVPKSNKFTPSCSFTMFRFWHEPNLRPRQAARLLHMYNRESWTTSSSASIASSNPAVEAEVLKEAVSGTSAWIEHHSM